MTELREALAQLGSPRLLVLGDLMLDRYTHGLAERISSESPVPIVQVERHEQTPGGAAGVAVLARGLGAEVSLAGIVGDDPEGELLCRLLDEAGIELAAVLCDEERPTTTKDRVLAWTSDGRVQPLLRLDRERRQQPRPALEERLLRLVGKQLADCDALLISDYAKGVCSPGLLERLLEMAASREVSALVDPACLTDYRRYRGASLLIPNRREAEWATGWHIRSVSEALAAGQRLCQQCEISAALVKLGGDGIVLVECGWGGRAWPAWTQAARDVTGAGDMVLAMMGLGRASGLSWAEAAPLANAAAGVKVSRQGAAMLSREELWAELLPLRRTAEDKIVSVEHMEELRRAYQRQGCTVVLTNGCFDLLHAGHVSCLEEAARLGDVLIVAVNSDACVRRLKGPARPVVNQQQRATLVAALACVDHVLLFEDDTPHALLRQLRPDVLVKGGTYDETEVVGREVVEEYGGQVCVTGKTDGISTTQILAAACRVRCEAPT
ncbi:MAG TPA: D-glycero-beta-D-manno-heptose 1-phosphate adenylyltransferase [Gemmataceae bacterium]|nr:D-glycero-beta-D-manno-heptose 1-phosphate adenylyltransferase [Gemmataceae bacterium]